MNDQDCEAFWHQGAAKADFPEARTFNGGIKDKSCFRRRAQMLDPNQLMVI
jgi:hypothetical protein